MVDTWPFKEPSGQMRGKAQLRVLAKDEKATSVRVAGTASLPFFQKLPPWGEMNLAERSKNSRGSLRDSSQAP